MAVSPTSNKARPLRGSFITFEGIDGCGKTTQAESLGRRLREAGHELVETREPGGTAVGRELRGLLLSPDHAALTPDCELLLFLADRVQHLRELILPALARGETVICDRHHDSTVAFQRFGRELDFTPVDSVVRHWIEPHAPQLTFWLDAPPEVAWARIQQRLEAGTGGEQGTTRLENEARNFHLRVKAGYEKLFEAFPERIVRIDAEGSIDEIAAEVWNILTDRYDLF